MSKFQKNVNKWRYIKISEENGRFLIPYKQIIRLQEDICDEIAYYKSSQVIKDYEQKDINGNYYKINDASRKFESSQLYKDMHIDETDILLNLEVAELIKVDIDKDVLSKTDIENYINGKESIETAPVVYIFRCHYYLDDKNDIPLYVKINFGYNRDEQNKIQDCLYIKSIHLDTESCPSKEIYYKDFNKNLYAKPSWERDYEYINEDDYRQKHPEELFIEDPNNNKNLNNREK